GGGRPSLGQPPLKSPLLSCGHPRVCFLVSPPAIRHSDRPSANVGCGLGSRLQEGESPVLALGARKSPAAVTYSVEVCPQFPVGDDLSGDIACLWHSLSSGIERAKLVDQHRQEGLRQDRRFAVARTKGTDLVVDGRLERARDEAQVLKGVCRQWIDHGPTRPTGNETAYAGEVLSFDHG